MARGIPCMCQQRQVHLCKPVSDRPLKESQQRIRITDTAALNHRFQPEGMREDPHRIGTVIALQQ